VPPSPTKTSLNVGTSAIFLLLFSFFVLFSLERKSPKSPQASKNVIHPKQTKFVERSLSRVCECVNCCITKTEFSIFSCGGAFVVSLRERESQSRTPPPVFILFVVSLSFFERVRERERGYFIFPEEEAFALNDFKTTRAASSLATKKKEKITLSLVGIISLSKKKKKKNSDRAVERI